MLSSANNLISADQKISFYFCQSTLFIRWQEITGYYNDDKFISSRFSYKWKDQEKSLRFFDFYDQEGNPILECVKLKNISCTKIFDLRDNEIQVMDQDDCKIKGEDTKKWFRRDNLYETTTYSQHLLVFFPTKFKSETIFKYS